MNTNTINLDDTTSCPQTTLCQCCIGTNDLKVVTFTAVTEGGFAGVFCSTLCIECRHNPNIGGIAAYALGWYGIEFFLREHCQHLGITPEKMCTALIVEQADIQEN